MKFEKIPDQNALRLTARKLEANYVDKGKKTKDGAIQLELERDGDNYEFQTMLRWGTNMPKEDAISSELKDLQTRYNKLKETSKK